MPDCPKLGRLRSLLVEGQISLKSPAGPPPEAQEAIQEALQGHMTALRGEFGRTLGRQGDALSYRRALGRGLERVGKASHRGAKSGLIAPGEEMAAEDFAVAAKEFRRMIDLISRYHQGRPGSNFGWAANLLPYHSPESLEQDLERFSGLPPSTVFQALCSHRLNPAGALESFLVRLREDLSDRGLQAMIEAKGFRLREGELESLFAPWVRERLAWHNGGDLPSAASRVMANARLLTKDRIRQACQRAGMEFSNEDLEDRLPPYALAYLAVKFPVDPMEACLRFLRGEIKIGGVAVGQ